MKKSIPCVLFLAFFLTMVIQVSAKHDGDNLASNPEIQSLNDCSAPDSSKQIIVLSDPKNAAVFINGSLKGITPLICRVESNYMKISISQEGYYPTDTIVFLSDGNFSFSFKLLKLFNSSKQLSSPFKAENEFQILGSDDRNTMDVTNSSHEDIQYPYTKQDELKLTYEEQVYLAQYDKRIKIFTFTAVGCGAISFISFGIAAENYRLYKTSTQYVDYYRKTVQTFDVITVTSLAAGIVSTGFAIYYGTMKRKITKTGRVNVGIVSNEFGPAVVIDLKIK